MASPTVVALHLSSGSRVPLQAAADVEAKPGEGLTGDRRRRPHRAVLFIEQEVLDTFGLTPGAVREQVTVRGVSLVALPAAARIRIGSVLLEAGRMCAPCERMNELQPGLRAALEGRRGRFFRVIEPGRFAVGDTVTVLPADPHPAG